MSDFSSCSCRLICVCLCHTLWILGSMTHTLVAVRYFSCTLHTIHASFWSRTLISERESPGLELKFHTVEAKLSHSSLTETLHKLVVGLLGPPTRNINKEKRKKVMIGHEETFYCQIQLFINLLKTSPVSTPCSSSIVDSIC